MVQFSPTIDFSVKQMITVIFHQYQIYYSIMAQLVRPP